LLPFGASPPPTIVFPSFDTALAQKSAQPVISMPASISMLRSSRLPFTGSQMVAPNALPTATEPSAETPFAKPLSPISTIPSSLVQRNGLLNRPPPPTTTEPSAETP